MKHILIVGGAGYIGSHMVAMLQKENYIPIVLDNLSTGSRELVLNAELIEADIANSDVLDKLFKKYKFSAVMHFASFIQVGESVENPSKYYKNNVCATLNLLDHMVKNKVDLLIFSSTAAIFGNPEYIPIDEKHPKNPINPYGKSKLMIEEILKDYDTSYGLKSICFRYFNAAGADPETRIGALHKPTTHLIPIVLQAASGRRQNIKIFGQDYPTPDKTCIRDYIHVNDICQAHLLGLEKLINERKSNQYNLGNGKGFSVNEVIGLAKTVTGKEIACIFADRRPGDPPILIADSKKAQAELNWIPEYSDLRVIIEHAWKWEQKIAQDAI